MNGVLVAVAVALVVALGAIGVLAGEGEEAEPAAERSRGPSVEQVAARVEDVARGVERVRELEFDRLPPVRLVSLEQATRESLGELDHYVPPRRQRIEERLLVMLGLLPPDTRLRELLGKALTEEVAGYYIPRTGTMALVRSARQRALCCVKLSRRCGTRVRIFMRSARKSLRTWRTFSSLVTAKTVLPCDRAKPWRRP